MVQPASWFAPGRVNVIGEHTDYNAGLALPMAIQMGCRSSVEPVAGATLTVVSRQRPAPVATPVADLRPARRWPTGDSWAAYAAGVVWALGPAASGTGWRIEVDSDLPIGAGLSSSAALCCSVAGALLEALDEDPTPTRIADLAVAAEGVYVGAPTGRLDQWAVTQAQAGHVMLCDFRAGTAAQIPWDLDEAGLTLVVADTGAGHAHADGEYAARRSECERACAELGVASLREAAVADLDRIAGSTTRRRARHVLTENIRVAEVASRLEAGRPADIGGLLTASHESMRRDFEITVPRVDAAVAAMLDAGALGARMTGGGFGGCVIGLVPRPAVQDVILAVRRRLGHAGLWATPLEASPGAHPVAG